MRFFPRILIFISGLISTDLLLAQSEYVKFTEIVGTNEISLGKIESITQDHQGFIWLADNQNHCLIRYDGNQMLKFLHDPQNPNSLGESYPTHLCTDSAGFIWIGLFGGGLDRFDPERGIFVHYRHSATDSNSLSDDVVTALTIDHVGNIWIGTLFGLNCFNPRTGKFRHYYNVPGRLSSINNSAICSIYEDHEGTLWVGTGWPWGMGGETE